MADRSGIDDALAALRFDEAEALINVADATRRQALRERAGRLREAAERRARALQERIINLAEEERKLELAKLAREPTTGSLLALLPDSMERRAALQLEAAERWLAHRRGTNTRRMHEARRALEGLDLELARGLMNRIDGRILSETQETERDQLLLDISARVVEMESLSDASDSLLGEHDTQSKTRRRPWWRQRD